MEEMQASVGLTSPDFPEPIDIAALVDPEDPEAALARLLDPPKRRPRHAVELAFWTVRLTVDHITSAEGQYRTASCVNHLDNLRTLCGACHEVRNREQAAERLVPTAEAGVPWHA